MFNINNIRPKSLHGLVKAPKSVEIIENAIFMLPWLSLACQELIYPAVHTLSVISVCCVVAAFAVATLYTRMYVQPAILWTTCTTVT